MFNKFLKTRLFIQVTMVSFLATLAAIGLVATATTIGTDINTDGYLTVSGAATSTFLGPFSVGSSTPASNTLFSVGTSTPNLFVDRNTGYVGIGTTNPAYKLDVAGDAKIQGNLLIDGSPTYNDANAWLFLVGRWNGGAYTASIYANQLGAMTLTAAVGQFMLFKSGENELMRILGSGNVGIGDASPVYLLTVGSGDLFGVNSSGYALLPAGAVGTPSLSFTADTNTGLWSSGADTLNFSTGGSERVRITTNGKVGIGTTSPYSLLSISNSVSTAANTPLFTIASTTAGTATSTLLTVLASGNVGIATTTPVATLDINGYMKLKMNTSQPVVCSANYAGSIAVASSYMTCICNGITNSWINIASSTQACSW